MGATQNMGSRWGGRVSDGTKTMPRTNHVRSGGVRWLPTVRTTARDWCSASARRSR